MSLLLLVKFLPVPTYLSVSAYWSPLTSVHCVCRSAIVDRCSAAIRYFPNCLSSFGRIPKRTGLMCTRSELDDRTQRFQTMACSESCSCLSGQWLQKFQTVIGLICRLWNCNRTFNWQKPDTVWNGNVVACVRYSVCVLLGQLIIFLTLRIIGLWTFSIAQKQPFAKCFNLRIFL